jgi:hypothetical protein
MLGSAHSGLGELRRGDEMSAASRESALRRRETTVRKHLADDRADRLARAVANVLDGSCDSAMDAALGQGVSVEAVRKAVAAAKERRQ